MIWHYWIDLRKQHSSIHISIHIWLVVSTHLNNISQWEGFSHILWKIKNVPNHQPDILRSSLIKSSEKALQTDAPRFLLQPMTWRWPQSSRNCCNFGSCCKKSLGSAPGMLGSSQIWAVEFLPGLVMTNSSPWLSHGPNRNRWFTELNSMGGFSMAMLNNQMVDILSIS